MRGFPNSGCRIESAFSKNVSRPLASVSFHIPDSLSEDFSIAAKAAGGRAAYLDGLVRADLAAKAAQSSSDDS
jgi:hypothetical protein